VPCLKKLVTGRTAGTHVRSRVRPCQIRGRQAGTDTCFLTGLRFYPSGSIPAVIRTHFHLRLNLSEGQTAENWKPSKKRGSLDGRELSETLPCWWVKCFVTRHDQPYQEILLHFQWILLAGCTRLTAVCSLYWIASTFSKIYVGVVYTYMTS